MAGFDSHTLEVLEFPKILSILKGLCLTPYGMERIIEFSPLFDIPVIRSRMEEISQMKDIVQFSEAFPLYRTEDVTVLINNSRAQGIFLEPEELLWVKELIEVCSALHDYAKTEREKFPLIDGYLSQIHPFPEIRKEIVKAIDHDGSILDGASPELKKIRMEIADLRRKITNRLDKILSTRHKTPGWQDDTIMQRDGRYVIPVISGQFRADSGIIHDRSQSGATLFVEPNDVIEMNNNLGLLLQDERLEIDRILRYITAMIGAAAERLLKNIDLVGKLDAIHAAANLAIKIGGRKPTVDGASRFQLFSARHPLLMYYTEEKDTIIPCNVSLDNGRLALIITGPNTGGKTVLLKTVGLLILMAQSGLLIPADEKSEIGLFRNIFADIGDEQSIELSLSTFSSHIRQIIFAVHHAGPDSLILLDEIGAGTDPKEGAALAESILLKMIRLKARAIVTTHYSQLKTMPMLYPEIENASFEFDRASLKPTFRLLTGIPGASYAVEIARRLGMPADIADNASQLLGKGERSLTGLIESLEKELKVLREDKNTLEDKLKSTSQLEKYYHSQIENLKEEIGEAKKQHLHELESILSGVRVDVERIVKEIRESRASKESVKHAHKFLKEKKDELEHLKAKHIPRPVSAEKLQPGDMVIIESLRREGELVELVGDNKAKVRIGNILSSVDINDLRKITEYKKTPLTQSLVNIRDLTAPGPEIHLRGMTVDEAREALDKFLDTAIIAGMQQIYVVHGKGTGALRKSLTEFLKQHSVVDSIRLGNWNEGGAGVTVVTLK
ncbi:MAG: endonuclease MutS2 [candidate division Zixibacteria bacterium]|nr:endonuclease MutS2 [candidate division Zixibacteria bacterium]